MLLTYFVYLIGMAQTLYFFLLLLVPFNETVRKVVLSILFHSKYSKEFKKASLVFLVAVVVICLHSISQTLEYFEYLKQEIDSDHHQNQDMHAIEQQTRVNFNKSLKYFYLTFYVLAVNLCIYGYTTYLRKLDDLQDKIKAVKESKKAK